jgi:predicted RNase H-like HicB family nuclease
MQFAVVIERDKAGYSARVLDFPECTAVGSTLEEVERRIKEALEQHLEQMLLAGETVVEPATRCCYVEVDMARIRDAVQWEQGLSSE